MQRRSCNQLVIKFIQKFGKLRDLGVPVHWVPEDISHGCTCRLSRVRIIFTHSQQLKATFHLGGGAENVQIQLI